MKLREFYRLAIETGMDNDPRGRKKTEKLLKQAKESFIELKAEKKKYFDRDRLINPYADTRILNGDKDAEIKKILVGIDMEAGEIVLADRLMEKQKIDLVLSHHPEGRGACQPARSDVNPFRCRGFFRGFNYRGGRGNAYPHKRDRKKAYAGQSFQGC